jgi:hypothetical protein
MDFFAAVSFERISVQVALGVEPAAADFKFFAHRG